MFRRPLPISPKIVGGITLALFVLISYIGYTAISGPPLYPYSYTTAHYTTASNVVLHDDVRVNSLRVGQVSKIDYVNGQAVITLQMNPGTKVYDDARAGIGAVSALGSEFISLEPGSPGRGPIGSAGIPVERTTTPVELDQVLSILTPEKTKAFGQAIQTVGIGLANQGQNINDLIGNSPHLLPNITTVMNVLADPNTNTDGLITATNLLASRFDFRTQQLAALLGQMDTTLQAVNVDDTSALQATLASTAPALTPAVPALKTLTSAAAATGGAVATLRPGLAATGQGTPSLRTFLRDSVGPFNLAPGVAAQAVPAFSALAGTSQQLQQPVAPFLAQLINQANPGLVYMAPYSQDIFSLFANLGSALSDGNGDGNWLRIASFVGSRATSGLAGAPAPTSATAECRDPYPAPGQAYKDKLIGACP